MKTIAEFNNRIPLKIGQRSETSILILNTQLVQFFNFVECFIIF